MAVDESNRPTVLILGPTPPPYHGVSVMMQTLLQSKIMQRFNVVVLDTADRRDISHVEAPDWHDVVLFVRQFFTNIMLLIRFRPALFYLPICQTRLGFVRDTFFLAPAFLAGSRVVVHLHGGTAFADLFSQGGALWRNFMNLVLRRVARFVVLGEVHRSIPQRWVSPELVSVVPNGIEVFSAPSSQPMVEPATRRARFRILFLSTLNEGKGLFVLLEAIHLVVHQSPDVECVIAGPWWRAETKVAAEQLIVKWGLQGVVTFVGSVSGESKASFLRSGDIFVFPSIYRLEGQPLVILEAMCAGLPIVASDIGSLSETIEEGITGFIVPQNDPQAVCERILKLFHDPELRRAMSEAGRARFHRLYTASVFADNLERAFLETLSCAEQRD